MPKRLVAIALLGAVATSAAMAQEKPLVRSRDGRIQAFVDPAGAGCSDVMAVRVQAAPAILSGERETIQRFIGGMRGALTSECPKLEAVRVRAQTDGRTIYVAHSTRAGGWAVLESPGFETTAAPDRAAAFDEPAKRVIAGVDARLFGIWAKTTALTVADDPARPEHAVWRLGAAEMTTAIYDLDPAQKASVTEQADALGNITAEACTGDGGQFVDPAGRDTPDRVAIRGLRCQKASGGWTRYNVVARQGAMAHVIQIVTEEARDAGGKDAAAMAEAIEGVVLQMW